MVFGSDFYIVGSEPGQQTVTGAGDILIDNHGNRYRQVSAAEANIIRQGTAGQVYTLGSDGRIR